MPLEVAVRLIPDSARRGDSTDCFGSAPLLSSQETPPGLLCTYASAPGTAAA